MLKKKRKMIRTVQQTEKETKLWLGSKQKEKTLFWGGGTEIKIKVKFGSIIW